MEDTLFPLHQIIRLNTRLFKNLLEDVDEDTAYKMLNNRTNNIMFIACHLLDARFYLCRYLGMEVDNPYKDFFDNITEVKDLKDCPPLEEIIYVWEDISKKLLTKIETLNREYLDVKSEKQFPVEDNTVLGGIAFLAEHESYHLGQIGIIRKYFGLTPIKYL